MSPDTPTPPPAVPTDGPAPSPSSADVWRLWGAVGWGVLLAAGAVALATGNRALGDVLDVTRWFR